MDHVNPSWRGSTEVRTADRPPDKFDERYPYSTVSDRPTPALHLIKIELPEADISLSVGRATLGSGLSGSIPTRGGISGDHALSAPSMSGGPAVSRLRLRPSTQTGHIRVGG